MTCFAISDDELALFRALIRRETGITLGESKRELVVARLSRRLRHHRLASFSEYYRMLTERDADGSERRELVNCITTNKTEFFREAHHFDFLASTVLPELARRAPGRVRIWSAGCSTGEEPYSIAMTARDAGTDGAVSILASDIDTNVLATAEQGVYAAESLASTGHPSWQRHFLRGTGGAEGLVRARPELRRMVEFRTLNLVDADWPLRERFDVIFCRNVMIYFDRSTQRELVGRFARHLQPRGWLVVGHTENLQWLSDEFEPAGRTAYRLREQREREVESAAANAPRPRQAKIIVGGLHASAEPTEVRTVLGSCVAACLYDPVAKVGGMNHFMLAEGKDDVLPNRYGVHAMEVLINEIMKLGGDRRRLRAKAFGGAEVLDALHAGTRVSRRNADFVERFLAVEAIPLVAQRLGGRAPLEVRFETHSGRARVRALGGAQARDATLAEVRWDASLGSRSRGAGDNEVTLF